MTTQRSGWGSRGQRQQLHRLKYSPLCLSLSQAPAPPSLPALEVVIEPAAPINLDKENSHPNSVSSPPFDAASSSSTASAILAPPPPLHLLSSPAAPSQPPLRAAADTASVYPAAAFQSPRTAPGAAGSPAAPAFPFSPSSPRSSQPVSFRNVQLTATPRRSPPTDPVPRIRAGFTASATSTFTSSSPPRPPSPVFSSGGRAVNLAASSAGDESTAVSFSSHKLRFLAAHPTVTKQVDKVRQALAAHRLREEKEEEQRDEAEEDVAAADNGWMFDSWTASWSQPCSPVSPAASSQSSSLSPPLPALPSSASSTSPPSAASTLSISSASSSHQPADTAQPCRPLSSTSSPTRSLGPRPAAQRRSAIRHGLGSRGRTEQRQAAHDDDDDILTPSPPLGSTSGGASVPPRLPSVIFTSVFAKGAVPLPLPGAAARPARPRSSFSSSSSAAAASIASDGAWLGVIHGEEDRLYNSTPTQSSAVSLSQSETRLLLSPAVFLSQPSPAASCTLPAVIPSSQPTTDADEEAADAQCQGAAEEQSGSACGVCAAAAAAVADTATAAAPELSEDVIDPLPSGADDSASEAVCDVQPPLSLSALLSPEGETADAELTSPASFIASTQPAAAAPRAAKRRRAAAQTAQHSPSPAGRRARPVSPALSLTQPSCRASRAAASRTWQCQWCTWSSPLPHMSCDMCGKARGSRDTSAASQPESGAETLIIALKKSGSTGWTLRQTAAVTLQQQQQQQQRGEGEKPRSQPVSQEMIATPASASAAASQSTSPSSPFIAAVVQASPSIPCSPLSSAPLQPAACQPSTLLISGKTEKRRRQRAPAQPVAADADDASRERSGDGKQQQPALSLRRSQRTTARR